MHPCRWLDRPSWLPGGAQGRSGAGGGSCVAGRCGAALPAGFSSSPPAALPLAPISTAERQTRCKHAAAACGPCPAHLQCATRLHTTHNHDLVSRAQRSARAYDDDPEYSQAKLTPLRGGAGSLLSSQAANSKLKLTCQREIAHAPARGAAAAPATWRDGMYMQRPA